LVKDSDKIRTVGRTFLIAGQLVDTHYYSRYIGKKTELWFFTAGLGDQTLAQQVGDCFLEYCDTIGDPKLGRIMFSFGLAESAMNPYRGDFNVCWPWGVTPEGLENHLSKIKVKQDLIIGPWPERRKAAEDMGLASHPFTVGVGPRFFKPLGLPRKGLGFAGLDNKTESQKHIVLGPAMKRDDFKWHAKTIDDKWLTIPQLNEWYNSKQILFGMIQEYRHRTDYMPTRMMESLASGTPIIEYRIPATPQYFGFEYPYMTESYEETEALINHILKNYDIVHENILRLSDYIRKEHNYTKKLGALFTCLRNL